MLQTAAGFDGLAESYDALWTNTAVGHQQRLAVWRRMDPLFAAKDRVLDVGCGTGIDALHLESRGVEVYGIDSSAAMVDKAQRRGVNAHHHRIEQLSTLQLRFDGAISNFGALNCVRSLAPAAAALAKSIRSGGYFVLCMMGRWCAWEAAYFLAKGNVRKAFRRFSGKATSSLGVEVFYPSKAAIVAALGPYFRLVDQAGIGLLVPPSFVQKLSDRTVERLAAVDNKAAHWPLLRSLADHRLYIFRRI